MNENVKAMTFSVEGEFITRLAREWMFCEGREFEKSYGFAAELHGRN